MFPFMELKSEITEGPPPLLFISGHVHWLWNQIPELTVPHIHLYFSSLFPYMVLKVVQMPVHLALKKNFTV